jgi:uncharacterized protein
MPVTSSGSSIKRWPNADEVLRAAAAWAERLAAANDTIVGVAYFGSYARAEAGVGSDLDLLVLRRDHTSIPDMMGGDVRALPVPADILHYTESEFDAMLAVRGKMADVARREAQWLVGRPRVPEA